MQVGVSFLDMVENHNSCVQHIVDSEQLQLELLILLLINWRNDKEIWHFISNRIGGGIFDFGQLR